MSIKEYEFFNGVVLNKLIRKGKPVSIDVFPCSSENSFILNEKVGWVRWSAAIISLVGGLLLIRPSINLNINPFNLPKSDYNLDDTSNVQDHDKDKYFSRNVSNGSVSSLSIVFCCISDSLAIAFSRCSSL